MTEAKRLRTAVYCRVSTNQDTQDGSFETQVEYYKSLIAQSNTMTLVDVYGDHGKSGREMRKRSGLMRMLEDCRLGKIDQILTKSISRFARNMKECIATIRKLKDMGVRVLFEKEGIDTMNMVGELFLTILAAMAEEESNSISQNVKWSRKRSYEMGRPIEKPSYGYRKEGREHHWVIFEPEAKRVRLAFYMAGLCRSNAEIRGALNRLEEQEHTGKVWKQTPLMNLLTNYAYVGDYLSNKQTPILVDGQSRRRTNRGEADQYYISEHHEAIISHELFDCVQEIIASHLLFVKRSRFTESEAELMEQGKKLAEAEFSEKNKEELPWLRQETHNIRL